MLWTKVNACELVEITLILRMLLLHFTHPHQLFPCGELQGKLFNLLLFISTNYTFMDFYNTSFFGVIQLYCITASLYSLCCLSHAPGSNDFTFSCARSNCLCSCAGNLELCCAKQVLGIQFFMDNNFVMNLVLKRPSSMLQHLCSLIIFLLLCIKACFSSVCSTEMCIVCFLHKSTSRHNHHEIMRSDFLVQNSQSWLMSLAPCTFQQYLLQVCNPSTLAFST